MTTISGPTAGVPAKPLSPAGPAGLYNKPRNTELLSLSLSLSVLSDTTGSRVQSVGTFQLRDLFMKFVTTRPLTGWTDTEILSESHSTHLSCTESVDDHLITNPTVSQ